ncbi:glutathione S-transferase family protein [Bordetella sp. N]|uniref:glutathione S-transferase family protein n=1 Tax=Bordetella sp. N TaxID=1746199 RepID=UPI00070E90B9|nr:glutathione S-transferase family protein [Bordetella sp. N]ALM83498.1 hypothetical protein ASB57_11420 [Bordetella sp. N]
MKLYYAVGTCSMGIHLLLEEIGKPYETHLLKFSSGDQKAPEYLAINPKGKVPCLDAGEDGVLTEWPAIAFYLAKRFEQAKLLPADALAQVRALEIIDYAVATVHMRGFSRIAAPANFSSDGDPELVKKTGLDIFTAGLALLEKTLGDKEYFLGEFSIADAAVFNLEWWANRRSIAIPGRLKAHFDRMMARPSVQRMLAAEQ